MYVSMCMCVYSGKNGKSRLCLCADEEGGNELFG